MTIAEPTSEGILAQPDRPRVVVGVDGSPSSVAALRWARRVAAALDLELDAVTSWRFPDVYGSAGGWAATWRPDTDAEQVLDGALHEAFGLDRPGGLRTRVLQGHPTQVLLHEALDAELLVVGSRGHGGFVGLLLGSVSAGCAEHATCPVVVVHGAAPVAAS